MMYNILHEISNQIDCLLQTSGTKTVAIDGNCAAGKSTLAELIREKYDCNVFHMDDYFLPNERKTKQRLEEAGGNFDRERFKAEVMEGIKSGEAFSYSRYDCKKQCLSPLTQIIPKKLNLIEGVYSMHPDLVGSYDLKIFLSLDGEEQSRRILKRNGPVAHKQFIEEWIPLENRYFDQLKIEEKCDLCFKTYTLIRPTR